MAFRDCTGETAFLYGHVYDGSVRCDGARCIVPIEGVKVGLYRKTADSIQEKAIYVKTDAEGGYEFDPLHPGVYQMTAEKQEYAVWHGEVKLAPDLKTVKDIRLMR